MQYYEFAEQLGVIVGHDGVSEMATIERLRKAERRVRQLKLAGINRPRECGKAQMHLCSNGPPSVDICPTLNSIHEHGGQDGGSVSRVGNKLAPKAAGAFTSANATCTRNGGRGCH